jgi:hypothetical protein
LLGINSGERKKKRDIVGILLGFIWALGFGYFSGITGFLRN